MAFFCTLSIPLMFFVSAPVLSAHEPVNLPSTPGSIITFSGLNFGVGASSAGIDAQLGQKLCSSTSTLSPTSVRCTTPRNDLYQSWVWADATISSTAGTGIMAFTFDGDISKHRVFACCIYVM